jgi:hypothetical protein
MHVDTSTRHALVEWAHVLIAFALTLIAVAMLLFACWAVFSKPNAKLFLDDNTVCFSQPFVMSCHERGR